MKQSFYRIVGGEVLGGGLSGKVISPAIPCTRDDISKPEMLSQYVTKIFNNDEYGQKSYVNETNPKLLSILKRIDPDQNKFIYAEETGTCENINLTEINPETAKDIAEIFKDVTILDTKSFLSLRMRKINIIGELLTADENDEAEESLIDLHDEGIVHNDLHSGNVVKTDRGIRIIDFGFSEVLDLDNEANLDKITRDCLQCDYEEDDEEKKETFRNVVKLIEKFFRYARAKNIKDSIKESFRIHVKETLSSSRVSKSKEWGLPLESPESSELSKILTEKFFKIGFELKEAYLYKNQYVVKYIDDEEYLKL